MGVELERHVVPSGGRAGGVDHPALRRALAALGPLPGGSRITFEPGGQLEVSSPPRPGPSAACAVVSDDLAVIDPVVGSLGMELAAVGLRPDGPEEIVAAAPRYTAMAAYLDQQGPCGRTMMCRTAALQVNLDIGDRDAQPDRWRLAHQLGPVLLASFANSPIPDGPRRGWRSVRSATWAGIDRSRTAAAFDASADPAAAWTRYALGAAVMFIRTSDERYRPVLARMSFARWLETGHELGFPTHDDLEHHLGTLFPPVRARGWLELRMLDSLPHPWWAVAAAVCTALLDDPEAAEVALHASGPTAGLWREAASSGLAHPALATASRACFGAALGALPRLPGGTRAVDGVAAYCDRFVGRGRCPADEVLERWRSPRPRERLLMEASWT